MPEYQPVPVDAARRIAQEYAKSQVLIVCWDRAHGKAHQTSYGVTAQDKVQVAQLSDAFAGYLACDREALSTYEDFRLLTAAEWAVQKDVLLEALQAVLRVADRKTDEFDLARAAIAQATSGQAPPAAPAVCPLPSAPLLEEWAEQKKALMKALQRLLHVSPFVSDADSCECGENGTGLDDEGNVCEHIQAHRALAKAQGRQQ